MSKISSEEVKHVAKLANLKLSKSEVEKFGNQLSKVVDYVAELSKVDTSNTAPTSQTTNLENIERNDKNSPSLTKEEALSGVDNVFNDYFIAKNVFEK